MKTRVTNFCGVFFDLFRMTCLDDFDKMNFVKLNRICKMQKKFIKLFCVLILVVTPVSFAADKEKLDIRSYEAADSCNSDIRQVRVTVNGVGSGGILSVELYHDSENFLNKKGRTKRIRVPAVEEQHVVCFNLDKSGIYAVAVYHDVDGNRKLNKKWNMMPDEPFGLSNNPELRLGFPAFSDAAFATGDLGADITINLQRR